MLHKHWKGPAIMEGPVLSFLEGQLAAPLPAAVDCRGGVIRWQRSHGFLIFAQRRIDDICRWEQRSPPYHFGRRGEIMRLYRLAMCLAVVGLTMSLGYSTSQAQALPSLACAVGLNVHPGARILLNHHTIAQCTAGGAGCKCVSCYNLNGSVSALCFPLVTPIPFASGR
ncbi:MAG: hypothetical protein WAL37_01105 [Xanthobacteraceae bacterium]|jgi:hypothetical protein